MLSCPKCNTALDLKFTLHKTTAPNEEYDPQATRATIRIVPEKCLENLILDEFHRFLWWKACGEPEFGKEQYVYNPYESQFEFEDNGFKVKFRIKVHDSPEGDQWVEGVANVRGGYMSPGFPELSNRPQSK